MILFTLAYILARTPGQSKGLRVLGWTWGIAALFYASMVGMGRCMTLSHWVTDVTGAVVLSWIIYHLLFCHVLRVPDQVLYVRTHGQPPDLPPAWELILCGYLLGVFLGSMALAIGLRGIWLGESIGFMGGFLSLSLIGGILAVITTWRTVLYCRWIHAALAMPVAGTP